MADAWRRMTLNQGNPLDKVLLRHEIYESELVFNQGLSQSEAHKLAQEKYPWPVLVRLKRIN